MRWRALNSTMAAMLLLAATVVAADDDIKLSGCLVRGHDGEGYLLTNVPGEAAWQRAADATVLPGPVGTSGTVSSILYWLGKKDGLDDHVGHHVEIEGKVLGNLQDGQIKVQPRDQWTEVEVESAGKSLKARVPRSVLIIPAKKGDQKLDVLVRRVEPQRLRMLAAVCGR